MNLKNRLSGSGTMAHRFGTDEFGRDALAQLAFAIRICLPIAFAATPRSANIWRSWGKFPSDGEALHRF